MSKSNNLQDFLTGVADAIRLKKGTSALIDPQDFETEIASIPSGTDYLPSFLDGSLTTLTASNFGNITSIRNNACFQYKNLTTLEIPNTITTIENSAFNGCTGLFGQSKELVIPNSVTDIGGSAFRALASGTTGSYMIIKIGNGVTHIGSYAFYGSNARVYIYATNPPTLDNANAFENSGFGGLPIYVPSESVNAYKTATNWVSLASRIQAIPS